MKSMNIAAVVNWYPDFLLIVAWWRWEIRFYGRRGSRHYRCG